jgi:hypothetical protein
VQQALQRRLDFLVEQGLAVRGGSRVAFADDLLATLRNREVTEVCEKLQLATGRRHRLPSERERVSGVYRASVQLMSGRFAMLDEGTGLCLVPWKPLLEQRVGQQVTAVLRGSSVTWNFKQRGVAL